MRKSCPDLAICSHAPDGPRVGHDKGMPARLEWMSRVYSEESSIRWCRDVPEREERLGEAPTIYGLRRDRR
jgi:hypothetical protein